MWKIYFDNFIVFDTYDNWLFVNIMMIWIYDNVKWFIVGGGW